MAAILFEVLLSLFIGLVIFSPIIYLLYWLGVLFYAGLLLVTLSLLIVAGFVLWAISCRGQSGCLSGVILLPAIILMPLGLGLVTIDYFLG